MATTPLPHDTNAPSITLLCNTTAYNGPLLDKLKANHKPWLKSVDLFLTLTGFIGYVTGAMPEPSTSNPCTLTDWRANDTMAAEWKYADHDKGAKACWDALKKCHQRKGPIQQIPAAAGGTHNLVHEDHTAPCHC